MTCASPASLSATDSRRTVTGRALLFAPSVGRKFSSAQISGWGLAPLTNATWRPSGWKLVDCRPVTARNGTQSCEREDRTVRGRSKRIRWCRDRRGQRARPLSVQACVESATREAARPRAQPDRRKPPACGSSRALCPDGPAPGTHSIRAPGTGQLASPSTLAQLGNRECVARGRRRSDPRKERHRPHRMAVHRDSTRRAEQPFRSGREILFENVYALVRRAIEQFEPALMCEGPVLIEQAYAECNERGCRDTDDQDKEDQNAARRPQPFADARHTAVHLHLFEHPSMAVSSRLRQDCVNAPTLASRPTASPSTSASPIPAWRGGSGRRARPTIQSATSNMSSAKRSVVKPSRACSDRP